MQLETGMERFTARPRRRTGPHVEVQAELHLDQHHLHENGQARRPASIAPRKHNPGTVLVRDRELCISKFLALWGSAKVYEEST